MLRLFSLFALVTILVSCATNSNGRSRLSLVSDERVVSAGNKSFERMKRREFVEHDPKDNAFVKCVVAALDKTLDSKGNWETVIFKNDEANAFALPGRKIGVNSGLLRVALNADQLAVVLGHEMAHVVAKHGDERMSQQVGLKSVVLAASFADRSSARGFEAADTLAQIGILYPFNKVQEIEADTLGLRLMAKAGFKPREAVNFWENMSIYGDSTHTGFFSGHPTDEDRRKNLERHMNEAIQLSSQTDAVPICIR